MPRSSHLATVLLTLTLAACSLPWSKDKVPVVTDVTVYGAMNGTIEAVSLLYRWNGPSRPSALLGVFMTHYLSVPSIAFQGAIAGTTYAMRLLNQDQEEGEGAYAVMTELNALLETDLYDLVARSADSENVLTAYQTQLAAMIDRAKNEETAVGQRQKIAQTEGRDLRTKVAAAERASRDAIKLNNYALASAKNDEAAALKADADRAAMNEKQLRETDQLLAKIIKTASSRANAIQVNRSAILAGIRVTDVPGVVELGVIEETKKSGRSTTNTTGTPFGLP